MPGGRARAARRWRWRSCGSVSNDAIATAVAPVGPIVQSAQSAATIVGVRSPALTIAKTVDRSTVATAGTQVVYSYLITNTGNVTLSNVEAVESAFTGSGPVPVPVCPPAAAALAPGDSVTCTAPYTATAGDAAAGSWSNTATAAGTAPGGLRIASGPSAAVVAVVPAVSPSALGSTGSDAAGPLLGAAMALLLLGVLVALAHSRRAAV